MTAPAPRFRRTVGVTFGVTFGVVVASVVGLCASNRNDVLAAIAAAADRPFDMKKCTDYAAAIATRGLFTPDVGYVCSSFIEPSKARASIEALKVAVRDRLASSASMQSGR